MYLWQSPFSKILNFKYMLWEHSLKLNMGLRVLQNWVLTLNLWMGKLVMKVWFMVWDFSFLTQEGNGIRGAAGNHGYWWTGCFSIPFEIKAKYVSRYKLSRNRFFFYIWILKEKFFEDWHFSFKIKWKICNSESVLSFAALRVHMPADRRSFFKGIFPTSWVCETIKYMNK